MPGCRRLWCCTTSGRRTGCGRRATSTCRLLGGDPAETDVAVRGAVAGLEMLTHGLFADDRFLTAYSEVHNGRRGVAAAREPVERVDPVRGDSGDAARDLEPGVDRLVVPGWKTGPPCRRTTDRCCGC